MVHSTAVLCSTLVTILFLCFRHNQFVVEMTCPTQYQNLGKGCFSLHNNHRLQFPAQILKFSDHQLTFPPSVLLLQT